MSDQVNSFLVGAPEAAFTGPVDQVDIHHHNITFNFRSGELVEDSRGRNPRVAAEDELIWLYQRFVPPRGLGRAREILEAERTVLLAGMPGSGRGCAARMLLHELRGGAGTFHELLPDDDRPTWFEPGFIGNGDRMSLDLSGGDGRFWNEFQGDLSAFRQVVRTSRAHLVIVLPDGAAERLPAGLHQFLAEIEPPSAMELLRRYLRLQGVDPVETTGVGELADHLAVYQPMREVARLSELIRRARETGSREDRFPAWCSRALAALAGREKEVAELVAKLRGDGPQRALLLATALLHEAPALYVQQAAGLLLR